MKQVIELMGEKAPLTAAGLEQIVSIRAAINLGLSDKLKELSLMSNLWSGQPFNRMKVNSILIGFSAQAS
jgi:hypothetical protein